MFSLLPQVQAAATAAGAQAAVPRRRQAAGAAHAADAAGGAADAGVRGLSGDRPQVGCALRHESHPLMEGLEA